MAPDLTRLVQRLNELSVQSMRDPFASLDFSRAPESTKRWMPVELLSLHGTPVFDTLSEEQVLRLSQLELSLFCSTFCHGEKEVVANFAD